MQAAKKATEEVAAIALAAADDSPKVRVVEGIRDRKH